jgi:UDP-2,3-diacylglucosamine pyrophosphatase LpxH
MLVFISDIHFRDEKQWTVNENATEGFLTQNLIPQIRSAKAKKVTVVFLGDIVDINRSPYWADGRSGAYTPWSHWQETLNQIKPGSVDPDRQFVSTKFEECILGVLDGIRAANTTNYRLWKQFKKRDSELWGKRGFKPDEITFEFVAGNHDRLSQYSPATRTRLAQHLNLDQDPQKEFPWVKYDDEHRVLAFHGHVLGATDFGGRSEQPDNYALSPWYMFPSLGDVATLTFGVKLYHNYKGDPQIQKMLAEIDLVRPQSAVLRWLQFRFQSRPDIKQELDRLVAGLAQELVNDPFVKWRLSGWEKAGLWLIGTPKTIDDTMKLFDTLSGGDLSKEEYTQEMIGKITSGKFLTWVNSQYPKTPNIISGHTHFPIIVPVLGDREGDPSATVHYFNSGTWLDTIERGRGRGYARRHQITHVTFYKDGEDAKTDDTRGYWEYWEGSLKQA